MKWPAQTKPQSYKLNKNMKLKIEKINMKIKIYHNAKKYEKYQKHKKILKI